MNLFNRKNLSRKLGLLGTLVVFLFVCGVAVASEGGGEHGGAHDSAVVSEGEGHAAGHGAHDSGKKMEDLVYRLINFALMVIILFIVIRKTSIKDFFANRRDEIRLNFEELKRKKDLAEKRCQELEQRLRAFESSKKEIIDQYKAEGASERDRIIAEAEHRANQILEQTEMTIQREIQAASDKLKRDILDSAAKKAQEIIAREMKETDQDHLVNEFIQSVEKLH